MRYLLIPIILMILVLWIVPISAEPIKPGFEVDKLKISIPLYKGDIKEIRIKLTNNEPTDNTYLLKLRQPDRLTDEEIQQGYKSIEELNWVTYPNKLEVKSKSSQEFNLKIQIPKEANPGRLVVWLEYNKVSNETIKLNWASKIYLNTYSSWWEARTTQSTYVGLQGETKMSSNLGFLSLVFPIMVVTIIPVLTRKRITFQPKVENDK
jgi:hypothetical protein